MNNDLKIIQAAGPYHDFLLLRYEDWPPSKWEDTHSRFCNEIPAIRNLSKDEEYQSEFGFNDVTCVSDDILQLMRGHLLWIKTVTPSNGNKPYEGLHWYGPTIIDSNGAKALGLIFGSWANLLEAGPEPIMLQTPNIWLHYMGSEDEPGTPQSTVISFPKEPAIEALRKVEEFSFTLRTSPDEFYVMHFGI